MESLKEVRDQDPYPLFARWQEEGPVRWDEAMNAWVIVGYEECRYVYQHEDLFAHPYTQLKGANDVYGGDRSLLLLGREEHHALHHFLLKHFSPANARKYRETFVAELVTRRLDGFGDRRHINLATELAEVLPSDVIGAMLGLDWRNEELMARCRTLNTTMFRWTETFGDDPVGYEIAKNAAQELNEIILPVIRARRDDPRDDLISILWQQGPSVLDEWGEAEVLAQSRLMFFAGTDTTQHFLKNSIYVLAEHPEYQDLIRGDESKIADFGEEVLRFLAPAQFRVRLATCDVEIGGCLIRKGDRVHPVNAAANRDSARYTNPGELNLDRPSKKDHLSFNVGPRYCVGAALARVEEVEALKQLLDRYKRISWDPDAEPPVYRGYIPRSYSPLNVVLEPAKPRSS